MKSPYQRVAVYDLETGGLKSGVSSIAEIAIVVIDLESLEIIDTFSTLIKPYFDLSPLRRSKERDSRFIQEDR